MKTQHTSYRYGWGTVGLATLVVVLAAWSAQPGGLALAHPGDSGMSTFQSPLPQPPTIGLSPADLTIPAGGTGTTEVQVGNVSNLYGVEFQIAYNANCVQVAEDGDLVTPGTQITVGPLFNGANAFVAQDEVMTDTGRIYFSATLKNPATPINGGGVVASIKWMAQCSSDITFSVAKLSDSNGGALSSVTVVPGHISFDGGGGEQTPVSGTVLLQGRTNHSGTDVFLTEEPCPSVATLSVKVIPGVPSAVTDARGNFTITPYPGRSYLCLEVFRHGYLVGQKSVPQGALGTITLPAGDMNEDDVINIFDLAVIASRYGSNDPAGDVNGDGTVDIFDLTLAAGNFDKRGPVTSWQ